MLEASGSRVGVESEELRGVVAQLLAFGVALGDLPQRAAARVGTALAEPAGPEAGAWSQLSRYRDLARGYRGDAGLSRAASAAVPRSSRFTPAGEHASRPRRWRCAESLSHAERRELADVLRQAARRLPFEQRAAWWLCESQRRSEAEAGYVLDTSARRVRTHLHAARLALRDVLDSRMRLPIPPAATPGEPWEIRDTSDAR